LVRHLTLLAPAQDFIQILPGVEQTVEILVASRELGKDGKLSGGQLCEPPGMVEKRRCQHREMVHGGRRPCVSAVPGARRQDRINRR
jgi:hypothetical protein